MDLTAWEAVGIFGTPSSCTVLVLHALLSKPGLENRSCRPFCESGWPLLALENLENFSKALYGTTEGTSSANVFRPVMEQGFDSRAWNISTLHLEGVAKYAYSLPCIQLHLTFCYFVDRRLN